MSSTLVLSKECELLFFFLRRVDMYRLMSGNKPTRVYTLHPTIRIFITIAIIMVITLEYNNYISYTDYNKVLKGGPMADKPMTVEEICSEIGAKEPSVKKALTALGIIGKKDISDRRRIIYPTGTAERVKQWLEEN
jgi:hypothetical protein